MLTFGDVIRYLLSHGSREPKHPNKSFIKKFGSIKTITYLCETYIPQMYVRENLCVWVFFFEKKPSFSLNLDGSSFFCNNLIITIIGDKIKIIAQAGNTLDGASSKDLQQPYESVTLLGQGSAWWIISRVQQ